MASLDRPPPSTAAIAAAAAIVSFLLGYYIGQARSIGLFRPESKSTPSAADLRHKEHPSPALSSDDAHSSDDELGELNTFPGHEECKLVLVVRTDLGMTKGRSIPIRATFPLSHSCFLPISYIHVSSHISAACAKAPLHGDHETPSTSTAAPPDHDNNRAQPSRSCRVILHLQSMHAQLTTRMQAKSRPSAPMPPSHATKP